MADGLNKVMLLGNLGADPELRYTGTGQAVLNLRLATTESWFDKDANERKERTDWHNVVVWGKRAEGLAKILSKGSPIFVEGGLRTSSYEDKEGMKRYKTDVNATNVLLTGGKREGGDSSGASYGGARPPAQPRTNGSQQYAKAPPSATPAAAPFDTTGLDDNYGNDMPF